MDAKRVFTYIGIVALAIVLGFAIGRYLVRPATIDEVDRRVEEIGEEAREAKTAELEDVSDSELIDSLPLRDDIDETVRRESERFDNSTGTDRIDSAADRGREFLRKLRRDTLNQ